MLFPQAGSFHSFLAACWEDCGPWLPVYGVVDRLLDRRTPSRALPALFLAAQEFAGSISSIYNIIKARLASGRAVHPSRGGPSTYHLIYP